MILLLLAGCLDRLLESPYVLATGVSEGKSVCPSLDGGLLAATGTGVYRIDGNGVTTRIEEAGAEAVTAHPGRVYLLRNGHVSWEGGGIDVPGAVDILAGYDALMVLRPDGLDSVDTTTGQARPYASGFTDARAVALGPEESYLVVTSDTLWSAGPAGVTPRVKGLVDARAAATDRQGRVYVVQGDPSELWRRDGGELTRVARWFDGVRDLHFGVGGLLPPENVYMVGDDGTVGYVRPP